MEIKGTDSRVVSNDDELTVRRDHPTYAMTPAAVSSQWSACLSVIPQESISKTMANDGVRRCADVLRCADSFPLKDSTTKTSSEISFLSRLSFRYKPFHSLFGEDSMGRRVHH